MDCGDLHNAVAIFIHVGKKTGDKNRELALLLSMNGFHDGNSRIYWEQGEIINSILRICKHEVADLLVAGASERENFALPIGQITTGIAMKAKCSVLIFAGSPAGGFKNIVVNGGEHEKTELTVLTSLFIAKKENVASINITDDDGIYSVEETSNDFIRRTFNTGSSIFRETIDSSKIHINFISLANEQCETISEYAFKNN